YVVSARYPSLCFFFSPSPAATLIYPLPHTTLFRSADFFIYDIRLRPDNIKSPGIPIHDSIGGYKYSPSDDIRYLLTPFRTVVEQDRKSTRLNSSHVSISYAVFCLKEHHQKEHKTSS